MQFKLNKADIHPTKDTLAFIVNERGFAGIGKYENGIWYSLPDNHKIKADEFYWVEFDENLKEKDDL